MKIRFIKMAGAVLLGATILTVAAMPAFAHDCSVDGHILYGGEASEPTCYADGGYWLMCSECDYEEFVATQPALGHDLSYEYWEIVPTCGTEGLYAKACTRCDYVEYTTTPRNHSNHEFTGEWTVVQYPTCTKEGIEEMVCCCGSEVTSETIPKTDHNYGPWKTTKEATCSEEGKVKATCKDCGTTIEDDTAKTSHSYEAWTLKEAPTDCEDGIEERKCKVCGYKDKQAVRPEGTIEQGTKNEIGVYVLQELLAEEDLLNDRVDGIYGKNTTAAVKEFQDRMDFEPSGTAYPQTITALMVSLEERENLTEKYQELGSGISVKKEGKTLSFKLNGETYDWNLPEEEEVEEETEVEVKAETTGNKDGINALKNFFGKKNS